MKVYTKCIKNIPNTSQEFAISFYSNHPLADIMYRQAVNLEIHPRDALPNPTLNVISIFHRTLADSSDVHQLSYFLLCLIQI